MLLLKVHVGIQPPQDLVQEVVATTQLVKETRLGCGCKDLVGVGLEDGERKNGGMGEESRKEKGSIDVL